MHTVGSRAAVWHGNAEHTSGGLTKKDLLQNKWGRIVSAKKHKTAKKEKRLEKAGFFAKKGKFGSVKRATKKMRKSRKARKMMNGGEGETAAAATAVDPATALEEPVVPAEMAPASEVKAEEPVAV